MKLKPFEINRVSGEVKVDLAWRPIIEQCCELKEAIDHASRWPTESPWKKTMENVLMRHDLAISDIPSHSSLKGNLPHHFACLLGGDSIFTVRNPIKENIGKVMAPAWSTLGWVRKPGYDKTPTLTTTELISKARSTPSDASTYVVGGIPLFMASEGKNRTQLQRFANAARETELTIFALRDVSTFCLRPLAFIPGLLVLEDANHCELLPFRAISKSLLIAIGVRWSKWPSFKPWVGEALKLGKPWEKGNVEKRIRIGLLTR